MRRVATDGMTRTVAMTRRVATDGLTRATAMTRRVATDGLTRAAIVALVAALAVLVAVPAQAAVSPTPELRLVASAAVPPAPEPRLVAWGGVEDAKRWARARSGSVSFAVADGRRIRGVAVDRRYPSASVVKAMLALAVVRSARGRELTGGERALLGPMIRVSDNAAASTVYRRVGGSGLERLAERAGMTRFADVGNWADAQLTAADQARLFLRIDRLAPRRHRSYLRRLLASIVGSQRWGIAPVAEERDFAIMFKGGWRTRIAHQVALLERDGRRIALAVLTSGTGDAYGRATQAGIAARVLASRPARPRGDASSRGRGATSTAAG